MLRKVFSFGGVLLLAGAAVFATPGFALAQRGGGHGGGGHGGGGHFGGAHFGGGHFGGAHIGGGHFGGVHVGGGRFGGARLGGFRGGFHRGFGGFAPFYGGYGAYPYFDNYGSYYDTNPYPWSGPAYDAGADAYGEEAPSYDGSYAASAPPADDYESSEPTAAVPPVTSAHVIVNVPAGAQLWFNGTRMTETGRVRQFYSPPLEPGSRYTYDVQARWNQNGQEVTQTRQIEVSAGAHVNLTFPLPAGTAGREPAVNKG